MLRGSLSRLACATSSLGSRSVTSSTTSGGSGGRHNKQQHGKQSKYNSSAGAIGAAAGSCLLAAVGVKLSAEERIKAVEKGAVLDIEKEDKIRQYHPIDSLFDYFSSYQLIDNKGKKTTLMSGRNFYNAMTPGSSIGHAFGKGKGSYMIITEEDLEAEWMTSQNQIPGPKDGLLNQINRQGLMTYTDFHFLFLLMSTPRRYVDMIFHAFDVSADGNIEAKEFIYILAKIANVKTDPEEMMKSRKSGLVKYLFGEQLDGELQKETFKELQAKLIDDVLSLEFTRYCSKTEKMTEEDFCRHMLYTSSLTSKKKEKMLARVSKRFKGKGPGISFTSFKNFYNVLFGGADLERAMFYLDTEGRGVDRKEFAKIANWVCNQELDPHVVDVIYTLLDEDGDENLSTREFNPILFQWRHSRGFQKGSLAMSVGSLKF